MTFQELADKIQSGQTLSDSEQKEFFSLLGEESMKFKKEQPEKYLEFLKTEAPNFQNAKDYILKKLEKNDPSSVHHSIFAIEYFFKNVLNQKIYIPKPKRNKTIP